MSKDQSIAEQRERERRIAKQALPEITKRLRRGEEPLEIARAESERHDIELKKFYKWVVVVAEEFERSRRRTAIRGAVLLWSGFAAGASAVAVALFGAGLNGPLWTLPVVAVVLIAAGLYVALTARSNTSVAEELLIESVSSLRIPVPEDRAEMAREAVDPTR